MRFAVSCHRESEFALPDLAFGFTLMVRGEAPASARVAQG